MENQTNPFWGDSKKWQQAAFNTFSCLIGCSIGDLGTMRLLGGYGISMQTAWAWVLCMAAGLMTSLIWETVILKVKEKLSWRLSLQMAFSMSFLSMLAMEATENITEYWLTAGTMNLTWMNVILSMSAGFLVPLPYHYYQLKKYHHSCHARPKKKTPQKDTPDSH